jgi:hypothetical protein
VEVTKGEESYCQEFKRDYEVIYVEDAGEAGRVEPVIER